MKLTTGTRCSCRAAWDLPGPPDRAKTMHPEKCERLVSLAVPALD